MTLEDICLICLQQRNFAVKEKGETKTNSLSFLCLEKHTVQWGQDEISLFKVNKLINGVNVWKMCVCVSAWLYLYVVQ